MIPNHKDAQGLIFLKLMALRYSPHDSSDFVRSVFTSAPLHGSKRVPRGQKGHSRAIR